MNWMIGFVLLIGILVLGLIGLALLIMIGAAILYGMWCGLRKMMKGNRPKPVHLHSVDPIDEEG